MDPYYSAQPPSETQASRKSITTFSTEAAVSKILKDKKKVVQFREMVIMHIKKNELSTKIISSDFDNTSNDIILPLPSFKQCLSVIGINLSPKVSIF